MKKIFALFTTILLLSPCTITAQTEDNEYSFDENAISITDENGNDEEIEFWRRIKTGWKKKMIQSALNWPKLMRSCAGGDMCIVLHGRKLTGGLCVTDILIR